MILLLGIGLAMLLAEFLLRSLMPQKVKSPLDIYQADPGLKFKLQANASASLVDREFNVVFTTNSHGFRGTEFSTDKPRGTCRVLVIGDSFSVGYGVEQDKVYSEILENRLNRHAAETGSGRWQVINASVPAYSTYMYLEAIRSYAAKFDVDTVIVGFFVGNDFIDLRHIRAVIENGYMVKWEATPVNAGANISMPENATAGADLRSFLRSLRIYAATNSHLYTLLRNLANRFGWSPLAQSRNYKLEFYLTESDSARYDRVESYVEEMKQIVEARDASLNFLIIPEIKQVYDDTWSAAVAHSGLAAQGFIRDKPNNELIAILQRHDIQYVDMLPILRQRQSERFYFARDGHWNAAGHLAAAEVLFERFRNRLSRKSMAGERAVGAGCAR